MQNAVAEIDQKTIKAQAWRATFDKRPPVGDREAIVVREPRAVAATLSSVDVGRMLASAEPNATDQLEIVWLPPEVTEPANAEREMEAWLALGAQSSRSAPVRAGIRTIRVFWRDTRAYICAGPELLPDALDAVVRFTIAAWETGRLERSMQSTWKSIHDDAPLTHATSPAQQQHQAHVNEVTELAVHMKASLLRTQTALEQLEPGYSEPSKRLFSELVLAASLYDRLEMLEEPVQFAIDHYELANTRLTEAAYAAKERRSALIGLTMEGAIIALLAAEVLLLRMR